ncbi:MAG: MFS transporter [Candidatus Jettenia sp.]|uniref:MFS transporter n=1 Tax=Candidatus Jettenia sp. AMX1 TaxID=2293637 RepID=UPI00058E53B8|nr:MFS transporter [Candidatus Jettenia sp. AMX1]MBC6929278.1 MFS transporter [Candidatus Jettenia sp.]NUN23484.1 MFS transporter [Candidatus Jettenia caeni]KAA0250962.1 MAG: MFS transporter [Candidatus Jettenia sp. AMX1]MCE7880247.1 MFS transporter [Candidatus Jettenia sp. AMX1]MCQ3926329.1 MFS transporter [Candidatus Jettenia sp.]
MTNNTSVLSPFIALCTVGFFARISYAMARTPLLPLFALSLGAGPEAIGFVVGASTITGIFFKLPAGTLSDIYGRYKMLFLSVLVFACTPFVYYLVTSYWQLVSLRFFHGLATSIYGPVAMATIADIAGEKKGERLSIFSSITIIGNLIGAPLGGYILKYLSGNGSNSVQHFHNAYLVCGIIGLISLGFTVKLMNSRKSGTIQTKNPLSEVWRKFLKGIREVTSDYRIIITSNMEGIQNLSVGALEAFLPIYAVTVAKLDPFRAGILWGAQVVTTILAKPVMGKISDRYGRKPIIFSGMWICAVSLACIPLMQDFYFLILLAAIFGVGEAFVTSSSAAMVADFCKEQNYGAAMGTFGSIFDIGHAAGPILAGLLLSRLSYQYSFIIIALLLIVSSFIFALKVPEKQREVKL